MSDRMTSHIGHTVMSRLVFLFFGGFFKNPWSHLFFIPPHFLISSLSQPLPSILCTYETPLGLGIFYFWASIRGFPGCYFYVQRESALVRGGTIFFEFNNSVIGHL